MHAWTFSRLSLLAPERQGTVLNLYFQWKHRKPDAWGHAAEPYETAKYGTTLGRIPARPYRRILDLGCSEGVLTCLVSAAFPHSDVVGVDISKRALARARQRAEASNRKIRFEALDIVTQTPEATFDLVICSEVLYYLGDVHRLRLVSAKIAAVLDPGGLLVVVLPQAQSRRLCRCFDTHPWLVRRTEHVDDDPRRPFTVTVFERVGRRG